MEDVMEKFSLANLLEIIINSKRLKYFNRIDQNKMKLYLRLQT